MNLPLTYTLNITETQPAVDVRKLWSDYAQTSGVEQRNRLVVHYADLVHGTARSVAKRMPGSVDLDDLISAGMLGLIGAVEKFRPERGLAFSTYARHRIHGAILDQMRSLDWAPRGLRTSVARSTAAARASALAIGDDSPAGQEPVTTIPRITSMHRDSGESNGGSHHFTTDFSDDQQPDGLGEAMDADLLHWLLRQLCPRDRQIVTMYHLQQLKQKEIGRRMGLTEARVCQILAGALAGLQKLALKQAA